MSELSVGRTCTFPRCDCPTHTECPRLAHWKTATQDEIARDILAMVKEIGPATCLTRGITNKEPEMSSPECAPHDRMAEGLHWLRKGSEFSVHRWTIHPAGWRQPAGVLSAGQMYAGGYRYHAPAVPPRIAHAR